MHLVRGSALTFDSVTRCISNDSVNTNGSGGKNDFLGISSKKYDEFLKRQLNSNIFLEVRFHTTVPEHLKTKYQLEYKLSYSMFDT